MAEPARRFWTLDEFLAFDDGTDRRYELFDGQIVAMAPASDVHGALVARLGRQIGNSLRPGCEVITEAGIVPPERADSWYEADLAVTCAGLTGRQFVAEPRLIVEVPSPSTAATDRERKLPDYRTIPSLEDILVVSSSEARIEHYRREADGWKIQDLRGAGILRLEALGIALDLHELYAGVLARRSTSPGVRPGVAKAWRRSASLPAKSGALARWPLLALVSVASTIRNRRPYEMPIPGYQTLMLPALEFAAESARCPRRPGKP